MLTFQFRDGGGVAELPGTGDLHLDFFILGRETTCCIEGTR
jgi:hypothetical protein